MSRFPREVEEEEEEEEEDGPWRRAATQRTSASLRLHH
jgi:hypothetical protein